MSNKWLYVSLQLFPDITTYIIFMMAFGPDKYLLGNKKLFQK